MHHFPPNSLPTLLLDEQVLGLDVFMRDPCWGIVKVKRGRSRAEVLRIAEEGNHIPVTIDATVAERCRLKGVRVVELSAKEEGSLVHQILRKDPTASPQRRA